MLAGHILIVDLEGLSWTRHQMAAAGTAASQPGRDMENSGKQAYSRNQIQGHMGHELSRRALLPLDKFVNVGTCRRPVSDNLRPFLGPPDMPWQACEPANQLERPATLWGLAQA